MHWRSVWRVKGLPGEVFPSCLPGIFLEGVCFVEGGNVQSNLSHVLNLVRHEADRTTAVDDPFPMTEKRALDLIQSAALLVRRACVASPDMLTRISDQAAVCQCRAALDEHCGVCAEHRPCVG